MTAQLWCFGESGNAYKPALTMQVAGYDWQPVYVDFFNGEGRSPAFRALNPMGEVPVFREGDVTLTQSAVIQLHVAERTGRFMGSDRNETLRWLMFDNHKVSAQAGPARFLLNFLPADKASGRGRGIPAGAAETGPIRCWTPIWRTATGSRRRPDHRRFRAVRIPVLPEPFGFDRRLAPYRSLAGRHRRPARLETPL